MSVAAAMWHAATALTARDGRGEERGAPARFSFSSVVLAISASPSFAAPSPELLSTSASDSGVATVSIW